MDQLLAQQLLWLFLLIFFSYWTYKTVKTILEVRTIAKGHVKKVEKLESQKCTGPHKWVNIFVISEKKHVCVDCRWCPDLEDYVTKTWLDSELKAIEFREGLEKYTEVKMKDMAEEYKISKDDIVNIKNKIDNIKKNYTLDYIEKQLKDSEKLQ